MVYISDEDFEEMGRELMEISQLQNEIMEVLISQD